LRQAGGLKRNEPDILEDIILMRGLRDFNVPKIVIEDRAIFIGLIGDLFPGIEAKQKVDLDTRQAVKHVVKERGLQPEDGFVLKCVQFAEILVVRHSCFIIGNPGSGKTSVWKSLADAMNYTKFDTIFDIIDPKAVTADELYGCMNPKTKEWKDGVMSVIMRDMNKNNGIYKTSHKYKWIVLDGDVDPEWIESLNTVMDDNKVLTLVSQERIPMTPPMRLILEVSNLRNATPATVSRGGVLFINDSDVGWKPYFDSWLSKYKKEDGFAENVFTLALTHYINDQFLEDNRGKDHIAPVCDMSQVQSLTCIIDHLCAKLHSVKANHDHIKRLKEEAKEDELKQIYEGYFIFAMMWAYGGSLDEDKIGFNGMIKGISKIKFPDQGQCFDYFFDAIQGQWVHWDTCVQEFDKSYDGLFNNLVVPTTETTRQRFLLDLHVKSKKGMLYVGTAGTGKTTVIKDYFTTLDKEKTLNASINFNSYTDSKALQVVIESEVEKRVGRQYGPPLGKNLIYFMDDLNMPYLDKYGTQSPICLVRQIIDTKIVYDRDHLEEKKDLVDVMFVACQNPRAGSFNVDLRLTRHFTLQSCRTAEKEILKMIYNQILDNHFCLFDKSICDLAPKIVSAIATVFTGLATNP